VAVAGPLLGLRVVGVGVGLEVIVSTGAEVRATGTEVGSATGL